MKVASAVITTVVVASGIADGTNDANLASHTAGIGIVVIGKYVIGCWTASAASR